MKVAVYHNNSDIRIEDRETPKINNGEMLVKAKFCGICGTDVMEWYRTQKGPRILGHEMVGEIVESNSPYEVGSRVFVSHHVPCENCKYCNDGNHTACDTLHTGNFDPGGFSEFIRVPSINVDNGVYVLPPSVSYEEGTMIEPLACCIRGQRVIDVKSSDIVLVLGSGITGLLNIKLAKSKGAKVIATDINEFRLKKAEEIGAQIHHARIVPDMKVDKVIICAGATSAYETAFKSIDKGGKILAFAIPSKNLSINCLQFWRNELSMISSYGAGPVDLAESLELITSGKVNVTDLITDKVSLDDIQKGFDLVTNPKNSLKVLVEF